LAVFVISYGIVEGGGLGQGRRATKKGGGKNNAAKKFAGMHKTILALLEIWGKAATDSLLNCATAGPSLSSIL
jgi:hypothetical protein